MAQKIKKDDEVMVIAGKDKGRRGTIMRTLYKKNGQRYLYIAGINMVKKHVKPNPEAEQPGGIIEQEAPIHHSNVAIYNVQTQKADRVGFKLFEDGRKVRIYKSTGEQIDV